MNNTILTQGKTHCLKQFHLSLLAVDRRSEFYKQNEQYLEKLARLQYLR
ncbi:hypothetical protein [Gillisia limnaea]|nr:hypothetical protein [Gillisia limnaea]